MITSGVRPWLKNVANLHAFVFVGSGKERLIQLLDYSSVASPQLDFSLISRNKRVLRTKHDWLPVWQCDGRQHVTEERVFVTFKCFSCAL